MTPFQLKQFNLATRALSKLFPEPKVDEVGSLPSTLPPLLTTPLSPIPCKKLPALLQKKNNG